MMKLSAAILLTAMVCSVAVADQKYRRAPTGDLGNLILSDKAALSSFIVALAVDNSFPLNRNNCIALWIQLVRIFTLRFLQQSWMRNHSSHTYGVLDFHSSVT
ncbi:hypothetical protein BKA69DRAFT_514540 [Paraphysoderma sedebokerense]|nr:hypothetical protein BKA69DRAFT_514540 [Paraphysoderma sedebokerense]